jgi:hypothetical protein
MYSLSNSVLISNIDNFGFKNIFKIESNTRLESLGDTSKILKLQKLKIYDLLLEKKRNEQSYGSIVNSEIHCFSLTIPNNVIIKYFNKKIGNFFEKYLIPIIYNIVLITYHFPLNTIRIMIDKRIAIILEKDKQIFKKYLKKNKVINSNFINSNTIHDIPDSNYSEFKCNNKKKIIHIID